MAEPQQPQTEDWARKSTAWQRTGQSAPVAPAVQTTPQTVDPIQVANVVAEIVQPVAVDVYNDSSSKKYNKKLLVGVAILAGVVVLSVLLAAIYLTKDSSTNDNQINSSEARDDANAVGNEPENVALSQPTQTDTAELRVEDLAQTSSGEFTLRLPGSWLQITSDEADTVYTNDGVSLDEAQESMLLTALDLGTDYSLLTDAQKVTIAQSFKDEFSTPTSLENGGCEEISGIEVAEKNRATYDVAFEIHALCTRYAGKDVTARVSLLAAIKGSRFHVAAMLIPESQILKNAVVYDKIFESIAVAQ